MFFGLNNFIRNILPKGLFYRSLIIVAAPIIILQIIITIVFFDSLWIKANKGMTRSLVGEIRTFVDIYKEGNDENIKMITELYNKNFDFIIVYKKGEALPKIKDERWFSPVDRGLRRELKPLFGHSYWFSTSSYKELVDLKIRYEDGVIQILFPKNKIAPSSVRIFALWITFPAVLLISIALIFLKNQTRPIVNLAKAAEKFGKGEYIKEFRPSGAKEIRQAAYEFDRMRKRITIQLRQRSDMLSGISHDLRTPLTRLKLQLALLKQSEQAKKMEEDIEEMEKMLNAYLEFSSSQQEIKNEVIDLSSLIKKIIINYKNDQITLQEEVDVKINGRNVALKRCLVNLIDNALSYGKKAEIILKKTLTSAIIIIDDDGPGIPEKEMENVFKPFYRIDESRSQNKSGVGLGLAIANDIILSHGGSINLSKSPFSGLRVKITLPF